MDRSNASRALAAAEGARLEVVVPAAWLHDCVSVPKDSPALAIAEQGLQAAGLTPRRVAIGGGSDANVFRRDGLDCVLLSNGTADVHTSEERVPARALDKMLDVCERIVAAAAQ